MDKERVVEERQSLQERINAALDGPLTILAIVWAVLVAAELALDLSPAASNRLLQIDYAIWAIFAVDFFLELALAPDKGTYLRRNVLAGISVVLPFVRVARLLRLIRLWRSVSLVRTVLITNRATGAAAELFREHYYPYVASLVVITTLLGGAAVYYFDREAPNTDFPSFWEALWWSATMITTINTGLEPKTPEGRVVGLLMRVVGLAIFGYVTASIAAFLIGRREIGAQGSSVAGPANGDGTNEEVRRLAEEVRRLREDLQRYSSREQL